MKLSDRLKPERINLDLRSTTKQGVLKELVRLLRLSGPAQKTLLKTLTAREELGSTGVGNGVAIPHCRSLLTGELVVAVGRSKRGLDFEAIDGKHSHLFFLIVAPPVGDPSEYLIALGKVAQVAQPLAEDKRLRKLKTRSDFLELVKDLEK